MKIPRHRSSPTGRRRRDAGGPAVGKGERLAARALPVLVLAAWALSAGPRVAAPLIAQASDASVQRTLVMPLDNVDRLGRIYWMSEASAVLLGEDLAAAGSRIISREERLKALERLGVPAAASLSDATAVKIAQLVGAADVVYGTLTLEGDDLVVRAQRIRLDTGHLEASVVERARPEEMFRLFDRVAGGLIGRPLPEGHTATAHGPLNAFENYVKGLLAPTPATQVKYLQAALGQFPGFDAARLALWQSYTAEGEHARALQSALAVAESSPLFRRARFLAALSQIHAKQYDQAFAALQVLLSARPAAVIFNNLGVIQLRRGATPQAGSASYYFDKARESDGADPDYEFNLGYAHVLERDPEAAIYWLREAVRRDPADGDAHYVLGATLLASGATAEGTREKELALRLSSAYQAWMSRPADEPVPRGLERLKQDLEPPRALRPDLAFVEAGQRDQRELAAFHLDRGRRLFEDERDREAIAELTRSLYLEPYQAEAQLLLGRIYLRTGRVREAIDTLKISIWSAETAAAHLALAEAYVQEKDLPAARTEAQRALILEPTLVEAQRLLERIGGK